MSLALSGIGVSRGIAIGKAYLLKRDTQEIPEYTISDKSVEAEVARFKDAIRIARQQLQDIRDHVPKDTQADIAAFIDTHLLMMDDSTLCTVPATLIKSRRCNAEWAIQQQRDALVQVFEAMDDNYLRTRKDDIDHVVTRIQRILLGNDNETESLEDTSLRGCVLLANDLTPADTVLMQHQGIAAFVTEYGGPLSHTAILARSLGIPAIVGVHQVQRYVRQDEPLIVDGHAGVLLAGADKQILKHYKEQQRKVKIYRKSLAQLKQKPAITRDGRVIRLMANVELPEDAAAARAVGAEGVGLFRTEYLYMNRDGLPKEEEQLEQYIQLLKALKGQPLTIRTLDLGADKEVDGGHPGGRLCTNPALGLRAVRLCLKDPSLFRPQLRAILRCSAFGPIRMMIPMLSNSQEVLQVLALVEETKRQLERQGLNFDSKMPVGGMIEVPAAALAAGHLARHLDFLSLGTNDLIQYTLAIDRIDDEVNYLYDPLHPAVLLLIHMVIEAGRKMRMSVSMCGEMAGDPKYTRLLVGLGLTEFSMDPASILETKRIINNCDAEPLAGLARKILRSQQTGKRNALLQQILNVDE